MLPLEPWMFTPSLFVCPAVMTALFVIRYKSQVYETIWERTLYATVFLSTFAVLLTIGLFLSVNEQRRPSDPGGGPVNPLGIVAVYGSYAIVVLPSLPILAVLGMLAPKAYTAQQLRRVRISCCSLAVLFVAILLSVNAMYLE